MEMRINTLHINIAKANCSTICNPIIGEEPIHLCTQFFRNIQNIIINHFFAYISKIH